MRENDTPGAGYFEMELRLSAQLLQVLENEKTALVDNDIEALLRITPVKSSLVASFLTARQQLQRELAARGQPTDEASIGQWLRQQAPASGSQRREELHELQEAAKQINLTNGLLIQQLSARNQAALAALRGQQVPGLYGPDGQRRNSSLFGSVA
jgi:flagellar biosynthesis/type III secretory pathway chaperone